jgi:GABA permease
VSLGVLLVAYAWRARTRGAASTEPEFVEYRTHTH